MRATVLSLLLLACASATLKAQSRWALTLERGFSTFSEAAHDTSAPPVQIVPWHPSLYAFRLSRDAGRFGFGIALGYAKGELAGRTSDFVVLPGSDFTFVELAPELSYRIGGTSAGATLRAHAGPVLDLWSPSGDDPRSTFGGVAGGTLSLPLARRWEISIRADLAVTTSEVTKDDASPSVRRAQSMRRGRLGLGITRRF